MSGKSLWHFCNTETSFSPGRTAVGDLADARPGMSRPNYVPSSPRFDFAEGSRLARRRYGPLRLLSSPEKRSDGSFLQLFRSGRRLHPHALLSRLPSPSVSANNPERQADGTSRSVPSSESAGSCGAGRMRKRFRERSCPAKGNALRFALVRTLATPSPAAAAFASAKTRKRRRERATEAASVSPGGSGSQERGRA